ncbi:disease resistance protein RPS4 isoform X1 [Lactuca sativa]|nr:disease resistance protein RPS4 isoform X1 [Lactuca sativa]
MASHGSNNVFLSFSGEDTRHSFTDHLYYALRRAGISTFRDEEEIERGEKLMPEIKRIIKESRASVVVFSENYATSTWCLDELVLILEQRTECNHFVLPVFYHVDPSDLRKHTKTFAIEVKASSRWTDHNVNLWKKALKETADLAGMVLSGSEAEFLKEIVDVIYNKLDRREVILPPNITGMATRYDKISMWLNQPNVEFLAICGMGGSGKTTLAKYIYDSNWKTYENMSFVEGIGHKCEVPDGLRMLQEQLLKGILGGKKRKIPSVFEGTWEIKEALQTKRSLIVLDDITEESQLIALLGTGMINAQSKIIITTTRENTNNWFKSKNWRCRDYKMELLNDDESLELLSRHAFGSKVPMEGFEELAVRAIRYCEGNPLALEVLASSLSNNNTILHWKSQLNLLEKEMDSRIQNVLIMSYKSLSFDLEKELFLHIACFFVGVDMDYVVKILEHDYNALSGIKSLSNRCLLSVSPNKKLMMHRLVQEMGKNIVRQESRFPIERSRVWLSGESHKILTKGEGSKSMEGLALDMQMLDKQMFTFKPSNLKTDALQKMDRLKLLKLNFVKLTGTYGNFSEDLRWLCWLGSNLRTIPSDLFMGNLVAIDMSYSKLEVFEPPMVLQSLQILNLTHSHDLSEIRNMSMIPHLQTLILWNCRSLTRVSKTIGDLKNLTLLNMTGCKNLCKSVKTDLDLKASTSGGKVTKQPTFSFPSSLHRLFLNDCNLYCTDSFPLSFSAQQCMEYLNLGYSLFEFLPCYDHLKNLRVLDLTSCSMLKRLPCLPSTLAELYIYYCKSLEEINFQSHRFTLQEFGYEGCISLLEIEGFIKLVPITKLEGNDLGHMKWLKEYQNHEVCLVGDDELTKGRSSCVQMLYEFDIMSTSLPDMEDPNMKSTYVSESSSLSFDMPPPPKNKRLKGVDVTFKYTISSDDDWVWFCKINTTNGVDLMYNPKVFGKPELGEVGIWLSYWPIGNTLDIGDKVNVSIAVINGLEVHECGVSLVYTDDKVAEENLENNIEWIEVLGGDLSGFQLSTRAYYLCRRDLFELMEVGRLTAGWFSILVGDTIECTEVRGWRKTGRPMQLNPSFTELNFVRCIMHGPESEEIYKIAEMSKSSIVDKTSEFTSSLLGETMKSSTSSKFGETTIKELNEMKKSTSSTHGEKLRSLVAHGGTSETEIMASTDYQGSSSPRFQPLRLSMKRAPAIHEATSQEQEEVEVFQRHVTQRFIDLSQIDSHEFLSLSWVYNLLDVFLCCEEEFKAISFNNQSYMTYKLVLDYFERSVKGLDICNAIRDGIEQIRQWHKQLEIISHALGNQRYLGEGHFRRAKKAIIELTIGMLDNQQSNSAHRNRSFGKDPQNYQKSLKKFKSFSWSVSRSWSASNQLQAIGNNIVPPKATDVIRVPVAVAVYTMSNVLLFVMWALVAAIPCQDRGLESHFNIPKNFNWGSPITGLHERILEESKKTGRRNACGLLKEIESIEISTRFINELCDSLQFPLTEELELEVRKRVEEVDMVSEAIKNGLDPLEKQVRDVFHRIVSTRTQALN